ncbi:hypothetical protein C8J56DRAFT_1029166 [Mycena floridula]|nr:hypothetical protein C8J56DRAFT_1029166 [Mycena floridula]
MPDWLTAKTKKSMPKAADNNELQAATNSSDTGGEDEFLAVLDSVSHQILFVGFASVVGSLKALMARCEEIQGVKVVEREELKHRIRSLGIALVEKLKEARAGDLNQIAINAEIRFLKSDLEDIGQMLNKMKSPKIRISVLQQSNEVKMRNSIARLCTALERLKMVRMIQEAPSDQAVVPADIDSGNIIHSTSSVSNQGFLSGPNPPSHVDAVTMSHNTIGFIGGDLLSNNTSTTITNKTINIFPPMKTPSKTSFRARGYIPANTAIFHGRGTLVKALVKLLTAPFIGSKLPRLCILGPGGMGKTSVALEVMAQPELGAFFSKRNCLWLACVQATSVSLFLDLLFTSLCISNDTGDTLSAILSELGKPEPIILLFDNFETPWNSIGERGEIARILRDIEAIPNVALFMTMRGSEAPVEGFRWHSEFITPLDLEASLQVFTDIHPDGREDLELPDLLVEVGNMPLAVTLLARLARSTKCTAQEILKKYRLMGTAILGSNSDAQYSMDVCIGLSVESQPMKECSEALTLLFIIAGLPAGTSYDILERWWAQNVTNLPVALDTLRTTALVQERGRKFFVLPVIQSYVLDPSRFPNSLCASMVITACDFLRQYNTTDVYNDLYKEHQAVRSLEELNLQTVLLTITTAEIDTIRALFVLAKHQYETRPKTEVIEHVLRFARNCSDQMLFGDALSCYGDILYSLNRYKEAMEQFYLAREIFLAIPALRAAGWALLNIAQTSPIDKQLALLEQAQLELETLGNHSSDTAFCLLHLGIVHYRQGRQAEAVKSLRHTWDLFLELGGMSHMLFECATYLADSYHDLGQYDEAEAWGLRALTHGRQDYRHVADCMRILGTISISQGNYGKAIERLTEAVEGWRIYGSAIFIAPALLKLGRVSGIILVPRDKHPGEERTVKIILP